MARGRNRTRVQGRSVQKKDKEVPKIEIDVEKGRRLTMLFIRILNLIFGSIAMLLTHPWTLFVVYFTTPSFVRVNNFSYIAACLMFTLPRFICYLGERYLANVWLNPTPPPSHKLLGAKQVWEAFMEYTSFNGFMLLNLLQFKLVGDREATHTFVSMVTFAMSFMVLSVTYLSKMYYLLAVIRRGNRGPRWSKFITFMFAFVSLSAALAVIFGMRFAQIFSMSWVYNTRNLLLTILEMLSNDPTTAALTLYATTLLIPFAFNCALMYVMKVTKGKGTLLADKELERVTDVLEKHRNRRKTKID
ncbi:hypothetical protein PCE1_004194 [Barthelona sp. PCE]